MPKQRIQKVLAAAGVASRRAAEEIVMEHRVSVNRETVKSLPHFVEDSDEVRVDGRLIRRTTGKVSHAYFLLNKPRGVVCTSSDPQGRATAVALVPAGGRRLFNVGRLDVDSTGVLILTDDGELTQHLTHPRYGVVKTYVVQVDGAVTGESIEKLKSGMYLEGSRTAGAAVTIIRRASGRTMLEIKLREGRNREIRRMLARLGHKVRRLHRSAIGPLTDHGLKIGNFRALRPQEVEKLRRAAEPDPKGAAVKVDHPTGTRRPATHGAKSTVAKARKRPVAKGLGKTGATKKPGGKKPASRPPKRTRRVIGG